MAPLLLLLLMIRIYYFDMVIDGVEFHYKFNISSTYIANIYKFNIYSQHDGVDYNISQGECPIGVQFFCKISIIVIYSMPCEYLVKGFPSLEML